MNNKCADQTAQDAQAGSAPLLFRNPPQTGFLASRPNSVLNKGNSLVYVKPLSSEELVQSWYPTGVISLCCVLNGKLSFLHVPSLESSLGQVNG